MLDGNAIFEWFMGGGMLALVGFSLATYNRVNKYKDEEEIKRARFYQRIDEIKKANEEKFVFKDVCKILHEQTAKDIVEIKLDLKELLRLNGDKR